MIPVQHCWSLFQLMPLFQLMLFSLSQKWPTLLRASRMVQTVKYLPANSGDAGDPGLIPKLVTLEQEMATPLVCLLGEFHGQRSPWGGKDLDMTESLTFSICRLLTQIVSIRKNYLGTEASISSQQPCNTSSSQNIDSPICVLILFKYIPDSGT